MLLAAGSRLLTRCRQGRGGAGRRRLGSTSSRGRGGRACPGGSSRSLAGRCRPWTTCELAAGFYKVEGSLDWFGAREGGILYPKTRRGWGIMWVGVGFENEAEVQMLHANARWGPVCTGDWELSIP